MAKQPVETNVDSNLWAAAMRAYEEDKGLVARAQGQLRKHQLAYEKQGIPAATIRARYKERDMSTDERQQLYAEEVVSRRALTLCLWDAESEEDFNILMERAAATPPADVEELDGIAGATAYNDGFNSAAHGGQTQDDNRYVPGSVQFVQWARGCTDGLDYKATFINGAAPQREAPAMGESQPQPDAAPKKARGRPRKTSAIEHFAERAGTLNGDPSPANEPNIFDETPGDTLPA